MKKPSHTYLASWPSTAVTRSQSSSSTELNGIGRLPHTRTWL